MTRDDIIRMAREAGFDMSHLPSIRATNTYGEVNDELESFAALVAAAEREACALVCDHYATALDGGDNHYLRSGECRQAAAIIRARGKPSGAAEKKGVHHDHDQD